MAFGGDLEVTAAADGGRRIRTQLPLNGRARTSRARSDRARRDAERRVSGDAMLPRAAGRHRSKADALVVLALAAVLVEVAVTPAREGPLWANAVMASFVATPFLLRRSLPVAVIAVAFAAATAMSALLTPLSELSLLTVLVLLLYPYGCAVHADTQAAWAGLGLAVGGVLGIDLAQQTLAWGDLVFPALVVSLAWLVGRMARARAAMAREAAERAQRLERLVEEQVLAVAQAERRRIARELHDVVAHTLSVMVVQAGGARWTLEREPARAAAALDVVEETGRAALAELRRLLGLLGADEQVRELMHQPGLRELPDLVDQTRRLGLSVEFEVEAEPRPVAEGIQAAAYRVVQEALTNVRRHGGHARVRVGVRYTATSLILEITDDGAGPQTADADDQPGHGLAGMRERVALYGGELSAGPGDAGGFAVRACLPLGRGSPPLDDADIGGGRPTGAATAETEAM